MKPRYGLSDFSHIHTAEKLVSSDIKVGDLPTVSEVERDASWTTYMVQLFSAERESVADRSGALMRMAYEGAEQQWTDEQILAVLIHLDDRWGKYTDRRDRVNRFLIPLIDRARAKVGYTGLDTDFRGLFGAAATTEEGNDDDVWGFHDFAKADFPIDWMMNGLLCRQGIGLVVGYPGVGKTQYVIDMATHIATGDHYLLWQNEEVRPRKVLFVSLEMAKAPLHLFIQTVAKGHDQLDLLNENLKLVPLGLPLSLDRKEGVAYLVNLLETYQPDVVVFDSLQRMISKELTDEVTVKTLFDTLAEIRAKFDCAMLIVHHHRKKSNDGQRKNGVELSDVFGSVYITASVDFVLSLRKADSQASDILLVETLKNRLAKEDPPFEIMRNEYLGFSMDFEEMMRRFTGQEHTDDTENLDV